MGGLIARQYIQSHGGNNRVKSLITLGTPHHGTPTALIGVALMGGGILSRSPMQMLPTSRLLKKIKNEEFPKGIPLTSIFSRHDLVCPWWAAVLRTEKNNNEHIKNFQLRGIGHSEITSHPKVFQLVEQQLKFAINL